MKKRKIISAVCIILGLGFNGLQAQTALPATGGDASGGGGSVSYSVGQCVYQTYNGSNGSVAQGVQQPFEISVITSREDAEGVILSVTAFPNPATDHLCLQVSGIEFRGLSWQLYDLGGKMLETGLIGESKTRIGFSRYTPSVYFLRVYQNNQEIKTFKIIKN